jgi:hypothetical protein
MCAGTQTIVVNNIKKRKLQYISKADSDKLSAKIGHVTFADFRHGWNRWTGPG